MRVQRVLHFVAGVGVVVVLGLCLVEGKKVEERKDEVKKVEGNVVKMPSVLNFFRRLIPEKTLETIRNAVTARPYSKAKSLSVDDAKSRAMKSNKKKQVKETKPKVIPTTASPIKKVKHDSRNRLRTSAKPIKLTTTHKVAKVTSQKKKVVKTTTVKPVQKVRKQKRGKELSSRQNSKTRFAAFDDEEEKKVPGPEEMQVLTQDQKRDRLRQELVRETEGNCLAKILCGTGEKPKPKEKNTLVSDTAYLIKEFFNIFDFTIDDVREEIQEIDDVNKKAYEAEEREKKKKKKEEEEEEEEEEEDDVDDEEDEIYRKDPTSIPKKKYTTRTPGNKDVVKASVEPAVVEEKVLEPVVAQPKTRRPKPVSSLEMTTVVGDMAPVKKPSSNMDRLGEFVTPSSINLLTSTFVSTSMSGSATLKPVDMSYEIPLKTAKDDADDDDEEDDNQKYSSDDTEDDSTYHRVTLEELVGDIKLNPGDFDLIRRGRTARGMRRPKMMIRLDNVTSDKYIQAKLREMKMVQSEEKKLQIARKVARSMRQPRQCRQFNQVAQEVLQTCPLTTEVIRFFNTNLKNGTSIEVKRIPPGSQTQGGGLVFLNNDQSGAQHSYFVDNSPQVANTKVQTDLKNPSLPGSHNPDEDQYTVYEKRPNPNPENAHLDQQGLDIRKKPPIISTTTEAPPPRKKENSKEESDEEQDDEGSEEDEEEDDERRRRDDDDEEEEDEEENDVGSVEDDDEEYDDDGDEDDEGSDDGDDSSQNKDPEPVKQKIIVKIKTQNDHKRVQNGLTNQPGTQFIIRAKPTKPTPPTPTFPPGIIRVYGIPQPSFDRDFTQLAPIGQPINLFGDEFLDSPPYKRRRQYGKYTHRTSKKAKSEDDEDIEAAENVAYNARIPKHPPLEPYVSDGTDDDDEEIDNKTPYQQKKKHPQHNGGKPLGGVQGTDGDDDDDDDDKKVTSSEKKDNDDKDNSAESEPPVKIHSIDEPPFVPSVMYSVDASPQANPHEYYGGGGSPQYGSQVQYHNQYQQYQNVPVRRPHSYRPIVRPIKIMPDVSYQLRPGRLYPLYHGKK